jgi:Natural resistance-associated macrophage protein
MVLVTVALVLVQEMSVRLGSFTGKGIAALIREQFSLRQTGLALICVLLANTGLVVSEFAGIGAAFQLVGVSPYWVIPPAAILGHPHWGDVATNLVLPHFEGLPAARRRPDRHHRQPLHAALRRLRSRGPRPRDPSSTATRA